MGAHINTGRIGTGAPAVGEARTHVGVQRQGGITGAENGITTGVDRHVGRLATPFHIGQGLVRVDIGISVLLPAGPVDDHACDLGVRAQAEVAGKAVGDAIALTGMHFADHGAPRTGDGNAAAHRIAVAHRASQSHIEEVVAVGGVQPETIGEARIPVHITVAIARVNILEAITVQIAIREAEDVFRSGEHIVQLREGAIAIAVEDVL